MGSFEMRGLAIVLAAGFLTSCATKQPPGQFSTYRAYAWTIVNLDEYRGLPEGLEEKLRICVTEATLVGISPDDYVRLNAYARGEISESELSTEQRDVARRLRNSPQEPLTRYCPELHQEVEPYRKPA